MKFTEDKITEIFCLADDFYKFFEAKSEEYAGRREKRPYHRDSTMSTAEVMVIIILFHRSGYRCLKHFYLNYICMYRRDLFPNLVSYNRFVELEKKTALPLAVFIKCVLFGRYSGISFVVSTPLRVCKNQRIH